MKIAFDIEQMRPGCVLIAAIMGADSKLAHRFRTEDWLLAPTPGMGVYEITESELTQLVKKVGERNAG